MSMSDPIADLLTRIRNASATGKPTVDVPASKLKIEIVKMMQRFGFIRKFVVIDDAKQGMIKILLKYTEGEPAILGIERVSRPGLRKYTGSSNVSKVLNGLGYSFVSTSKGLLTDQECRAQNVGGEVICNIW